MLIGTISLLYGLVLLLVKLIQQYQLLVLVIDLNLQHHLLLVLVFHCPV
jgi:hypothetical protein